MQTSRELLPGTASPLCDGWLSDVRHTFGEIATAETFDPAGDNGSLSTEVNPTTDQQHLAAQPVKTLERAFQERALKPLGVRSFAELERHNPVLRLQ